MKNVFSVTLLLALIAACGSAGEDPQGECGPNGECPAGFTCDPVQRRCVAVTGGPDAGAPDAQEQLGCPIPTGGPTVHGSTAIAADEVWTASGSPHIVSSQLRVVEGATLTIEPCAEVHLGKDSGIVTGIGGTPSKLRAVGTEARPIVFKQRTGGERFDGLEAQFPGTLELAWVTVEGGGSNRFRRGASITGWGNSTAPPKPVLDLRHVTVKDSAGLGVLVERMGTFAAGSTALTVVGSGTMSGEGEALRIDTIAAGDVPAGSYTGNALDAVTLHGGVVDTPVVLRDLGVPYRTADAVGLSVRAGGSIELGAGVEVRVARGAVIDVRGGSFIAAGTAERPVKLRPRTDAAADRWSQLSVAHPGTASLTHTLIQGAGDDRFTHHASVVVRGDSAMPLKKMLHVDHVTVEGSGGTGVLVERHAAFSDTSRDLVVTGSGAAQPELGHAARIAIPAVHTMPPGRYTGNAVDGIVVDAHHTIAAEEIFPARGVPYLATGSVNVRPPTQSGLARLTIEPGVTLKLPKGLFGLVIGSGSSGSAPWPGELVAEGTAERPIVFTSAEATPAPGDWRGIYFHGYLPAGNRITHARIEYAGASCLCSLGSCVPEEEAGVMFFYYPLEERVVSQSVLAHIAGHGIFQSFRMDDVAGLDMTADNRFEDVTGCEQTMIARANGMCTRQCM
jgi:hypothetical protein